MSIPGLGLPRYPDGRYSGADREPRVDWSQLGARAIGAQLVCEAVRYGLDDRHSVASVIKRGADYSVAPPAVPDDVAFFQLFGGISELPTSVREVHDHRAQSLFPMIRTATASERHGTPGRERASRHRAIGNSAGRRLAHDEGACLIVLDTRHDPQLVAVGHEVAWYGKRHHAPDLRIHEEAEGNPLEFLIRAWGVPSYSLPKQGAR